MTPSRTPVVLVLALVALGSSAVSCTAILAPRDDVERCGSADDCTPIADKRYVPACRFDEANIDLDTSQVDKICVADFNPDIGCDPTAYQNNPEHPFFVAFTNAADPARYAACDTMTQAGLQGCPDAGGCAEGLQPNEYGLCDVPNAANPAVEISDVDSEDVFGHEVRDQFCRSYFCDDRFVCDLSTNRCVICDPDRSYGQGGCGEVFIAGARSCVYEDGGACQGGDVTDMTVTFGACVTM